MKSDQHNILVAGDLHLGRHPSRVPEAVGRAEVSVAGVWDRLVDLAIREGTELVLLSGDVVDEANQRFEARGLMERGLRRLAEAKIMVCAVAGNHDYEALPAVAGLIDSPWFYLIGQKGWERWTWQVDGQTRLHVDGWSFRSRHVRQSPLLEYDLTPPDDGRPVIGLLHGELGTPESDYAPLSVNELAATGIQQWILGHIHVPQLHDLPNHGRALYPGSLQPLDPGETGPHGAWWIDPSGQTPPVQVSLASLRYESIALSLPEQGGQAAADRAIHELLKAQAEIGESADEALAVIMLRLTLTGRTDAHRMIADIIEALVGHSVMSIGETGSVYIERVIDQTTPPIDLQEIANGGDAAALVAGMLLDLDDPSSLTPETQAFITDAAQAVSERRAAGPYLALKESHDEPIEQIIARARRAAWSLLDALLAQQQGAGHE